MHRVLTWLLILLWPLVAPAATFNVDSPDSFGDSSPGDGVCDSILAGLDCTLRAAVQEANALAGPDAITFTPAAVQPFIDVGTLPSITEDLTVTGDVGVEVRGGFPIAAGVGVSISDLVVRGVVTMIDNDGDLQLDAVTILAAAGGSFGTRIGLSNSSSGRVHAIDVRVATVSGTGIENFGSMHLNRVLVEGNRDPGVGGILNGGTLWMANSTVRSNAGAEAGFGGIANLGTLSATNTSIYWNISEDDALSLCQTGGIYSTGDTHLSNVSLVGNGPGPGCLFPFPAGGDTLFAEFGGGFELFNTIVQGGCLGSMTSLGYNTHDGTGCGSGTGDETGTTITFSQDPGFTAALVPVQSVDDASPAECPLFDQRGHARPAGAACDRGATEAGSAPACGDAVDNDGNGLTDANDPGCDDPNDPVELELSPGGIVVANGLDGSVVHVHPQSGTTIPFARGFGLVLPWGVLIEPSGDVLVTDLVADALFRVDPALGLPSLVSEGGFLNTARGMAIDGAGQLLVVESSNFQLIGVDPVSGAQSVVANLSLEPRDVVVDPSDGTLLVSGNEDFVDGILRVDPNTGTELESFLGGSFLDPHQIALDPNGGLMVVDGQSDALLRLDLDTGSQTTVTSGLADARGLGMEASGDWIVSLRISGEVHRVDAGTGVSTPINLGSELDGPGYLDVVPGSDPDADGILDDGDGSGVAGDSPCSCQAANDPPGCADGCDDNCPHRPNPDQLDRGGANAPQYTPGDGSPDGTGDVCRCGDMNGDGVVNTTDVLLYRRWFAGMPSPFSTDLCSVIGPGGACDNGDMVVMRRTFAGLTTGILTDVCPAFLGLPDPGGP